jgi:hypothetical protein
MRMIPWLAWLPTLPRALAELSRVSSVFIRLYPCSSVFQRFSAIASYCPSK